MEFSRRTLLSVVAVVSTSGCLSAIQSTPTPDPSEYRLRFTNSDSVTHNVQVEIRRRDDGRVVFDGTRALGHNDDSLNLAEYLRPGVTYELTVSIDDETVAGVRLLPGRSVTVDILSSDSVEVRFQPDEG